MPPLRGRYAARRGRRMGFMEQDGENGRKNLNLLGLDCSITKDQVLARCKKALKDEKSRFAEMIADKISGAAK